MIKIKFPDDIPADIQAWKDGALAISNQILAAQSLGEKHRLIDQYENHWRKPELVRWLSSLSHDKCWYTETKFGGDYQEVEHFRPKKNTKEKNGSINTAHTGYYWLAFDLENYRLCKRRPNAKKGTYFPVIDERFRATNETHDWRDELPLFLDPLDEEDYLLLSFDDNGKPVAATNIEPQDIERVEFTIDKYFLDEEVLNRRRAETWITCRSLYNKYLNSMKKVKATPNDKVTARAEAKKDLQQLKNMLDRKQEFSAVAKQALIKTGDEHAINIACS
ncbi:MAG TPA: hypothetical protein VL995_20805 [Cellvibrio sp.]|nr:hypothetical protein [Cellvibrio sp.]